MNILVFNCGSSSLTFKIFNSTVNGNLEVVLSGKAHRVGVKGSESSFIEYDFKGLKTKEEKIIKSHKDAAISILNFLKRNDVFFNYIGHRFVHGGEHFNKTVFLNNSTLEKLRQCIPLAPIHNPISLSVVYECNKRLPDTPQFVTFDSAFHSSIPDYAFTYAIPKKIIRKFSFRKYGFHGISYSYVTREASRYLESSPEDLKIVACHLGTGGSSVCAIQGGRSIDTSMGYSPLTGLMMSTRTGDIDPILTMYLMVAYDFRPDELINFLNKKSGLLGVSGVSSDIRDIISNFTSKGGKRPELAFNMYIHRLKKYIGSYILVLGGIDALVFTDDIGIHNWLVREKVCENMGWCGISIDKESNQKSILNSISLISSKHSEVKVLCIPTEEELVIAMEGNKLIEDSGK